MSHKTGYHLSPRIDQTIWNCAKTPEREQTPWPHEATPTFGDHMDTNSSLRDILTLALTSILRELASASVHWACEILGRNPRPSLGFQISVLRVHFHKPELAYWTWYVLRPDRELYVVSKACIPRALLLNPSKWGTLDPYQKTPPILQNETLLFGIVQNPQCGRNPHVLRRPPQLPEALVVKNFSLSKCLIFSLRSDPEELNRVSADPACHALGPFPSPSLGFQTSFPRVLAHKPSRLGTQEPYHRTLPALQKEVMLYGAVQNHPD